MVITAIMATMAKTVVMAIMAIMMGQKDSQLPRIRASRSGPKSLFVQYIWFQKSIRPVDLVEEIYSSSRSVRKNLLAQ